MSQSGVVNLKWWQQVMIHILEISWIEEKMFTHQRCNQLTFATWNHHKLVHILFNTDKISDIMSWSPAALSWEGQHSLFLVIGRYSLSISFANHTVVFTSRDGAHSLGGGGSLFQPPSPLTLSSTDSSAFSYCLCAPGSDGMENGALSFRWLFSRNCFSQ